MGSRAKAAGEAAQGVVTDVELTDADLFVAVTRDLADRKLLARAHVIKAGSVEVQLIPAEGRQISEEEIARRRQQEHDEIQYGSAG